MMYREILDSIVFRPATISRALAVVGINLAAVHGMAAASVKEFGAVGDGVADDTVAIVAAIAGAGDGAVEFPRGSYRITRTIEIKLAEAGTLGLAGRGGSARVLMAGPGPAFRVIGSHAGTSIPASVQPAVWSKERMPLLEGLEIVGEHPMAVGIELRNVMQPILRALLIRRVRYGIHFTATNRNVLIADCHVYDCAAFGIFLDDCSIHQMNITGSHVSFCRQAGIKIRASDIKNLQITGNDIEYNNDPDGPPAADIWFDASEKRSIREGAITGNTIQANPTRGGSNIRFTGAAGSTDAIGLFSITGNHIANQEVNIRLENARGVTVGSNTIVRAGDRHVLVDASRNVVISGNVFDRNPTYFQPNQPPYAGGIAITRSRAVVVSHNILDRTTSGSAEEGGAISIADSQQVTVTGCQVFSPQFRGIHVISSADVRVTDNIVTEEEPGRMLAAAEVTGRSPGTVISGNSFAAGTRGTVINRSDGAVSAHNDTVAGERSR